MLLIYFISIILCFVVNYFIKKLNNTEPMPIILCFIPLINTVCFILGIILIFDKNKDNESSL